MGTMKRTRIILGAVSYLGEGGGRGGGMDVLSLFPRFEVVCAVPPYQIPGHEHCYEAKER